MGRLAAVKLQREQDAKNPPKQTSITQYPGFAATGIDEATWKSQQPEVDNRDGLSKLWDALNPVDSGRSWETKTPSKEQSKKSAADQAKEGLLGIGKSFAAPFKRLGEGGAEVLNDWTGNADKQQKQYEDSQDAQLKSLLDAKKKAKAETDPVKKARWNKLADSIQSDMDAAYKDRTKTIDKTIEATDPIKGAASVGEIGFDVLTLGSGSAAAASGKQAAITAGEQAAKTAAKEAGETITKQAIKAAGKQAGKDFVEQAAKKAAEETAGKSAGRLALKRIAENTGSAAWQGGASGALSAVEDKGKDVSLHDIATGALTGTASGAAFGGTMGLLGEGTRAALHAVPKGEEGFIKNPFFHATTADNVDSILTEGRIKPLEGEAGVRGDTKASSFMPNKENVEIAYDQKALKDYGLSKEKGSTGALTQELPVNPDTVAAVKVGTEETAQKFRDQGFKNVVVDDSLDLRPKAEKNIVMPAEVEPPTTASLTATVERTPSDVANLNVSKDPSISTTAPKAGRMAVAGAMDEPPVQLKVLNDVQREADVRAPGDINTPHNQVTETKTQKGAQYLVDDIDKLQKETGIEVDPLDRKVAAALTGEIRRSNFQEFRDKMGRNFQDTLTYAARSLGKTGTDFAYAMLSGNKFKRDALDALRQPLSELTKLNKKLSGSSLTARRDLGARIGAALDDRANVAQYLRGADEQKLFDQYVQVFDYVKQLREKSGLETIENYRPWVAMKEASEPPTWLSESITSKRTQTQSRFSKERVRTTPADNVDDNLADMIYGYVNSQLNEMAYDAPVRAFKQGIDTLAAGNKANVGLMNEGIDYMRTMVEQAVNPQRKNPLERIAGKLTSNIYSSVLPFNLRLAVQNKAQKFAANSRVSKGAISLAKKLDAADAKELEKGLIFGDTTVYGQLEDVNPIPQGKGKGIVEKVKNIDPYQKSEHGNVMTSYNKGAMQAVMESEPYKTAKANGMSSKDAIHVALQDETVKEAAIRRGNVVVNDTQFGASPLSRPEMLREEGSIWGVLPKKTVYMFTRFPIGMSQHTLEILDGKSTRALEMLKNGDPRTVPIAEMRTNYHALLDSMKDAQKALKGGTDIGIPQEVLTKQIETVSKNLKIIDSKAKEVSQIRSGKTAKNLAKMWAAAAAVQIIFDGGIQSFADDPTGTTVDALAKTNPTASNKVVGSSSPLAAITSAASPLDKYGNVNTRAVTNYIPGVGLAVNRGREVQKLIKNLTGSSEDQ